MPYFLTTLEIKVLRSVYLTHPLSTRYPYGYAIPVAGGTLIHAFV